MNIVQCQGGWCKQRDRCAHYVAPPTPGRQAADRLCGKTEEPEPIKAEKVAA